MNFQRKCLIVLLSLLLYCELMEATGFGEFARMFPSQTNDNTCGDVAKVRNYMESTTRHESSKPISTRQSSTQLPLTSSYQPNRDKSTTDRSVTFQSTTKTTTDQPNHEQSSPESPTPVPLTEVTTKQLTSTPPTSPPKTTDQPNHEQSTPEVTTKPLISTPSASPPCAPNMVLGPSCDCERTCRDPTMCNCTGPETCVCPDGFLMNNIQCVPEQECGCYYYERGHVIPDGATHVQEGCSMRCTCSDNVLSCDSAYTCDNNAACRVENGVRQCYCNYGYVGDGVTCTKRGYTDCYDAYQAGHRQDGVFTILPYGWSGSPFNASCDMTTSGGGWTMIQRRLHRGTFGLSYWNNYKNGFGSNFNVHWLGHEKIFHLTKQRNYTLRVDLVSSDSSATYQEYSLFKIANESDKYRLIELGSSSGTAGNGMEGSLGRQFSTRDMDNDECDGIHCSWKHAEGGGWWYSNELCNECCNSDEPTCFPHSNNCKKRCTKASLNGWYGAPNLYMGIFWNDIHNIISTEMKIRPVNGTVQ